MSVSTTTPPSAPAAPAPAASAPPRILPGWFGTRPHDPEAPRATARVDPRPLTDALLYLDGLTVAFDGFRAIDDLSLVLMPGEMRAIIGPNGAGKTTLMDIVTGKTRPDAGTALFDGRHDLTQLDESAIARLGIGRKFQKPTVFDALTVADNVMLALQGAGRLGSLLARGPDERQRRRVARVLDRVRLSTRADERAGALSHGQKQWLEIAMLLAQDPKLLLVDEPVAGMTDAETEETAALLREIAEDHSVVVVEHDMGFVRALGVRVTCLHEGSVLAEGSIDAVSADPRVVEVYLGR